MCVKTFTEFINVLQENNIGDFNIFVLVLFFYLKKKLYQNTSIWRIFLLPITYCFREKRKFENAKLNI